MPVLENARHERFCQAVASGMTADAAYASAGFKPNRGNAARLNADESISKRIAEILDNAANQVEYTLAEGLQFCADVLRVPIGDVDERSPLAQEMRRTRMVKGRGDNAEEWEVENIKTPSKLDALSMLGKFKGWFAADKVQVDASDPFMAMLERIRQRK